MAADLGVCDNEIERAHGRQHFKMNGNRSGSESLKRNKLASHPYFAPNRKGNEKLASKYINISKIIKKFFGTNTTGIKFIGGTFSLPIIQAVRRLSFHLVYCWQVISPKGTEKRKLP